MLISFTYCEVAQLVEYWIHSPVVVGSSPILATIYRPPVSLSIWLNQDKYYVPLV